MHVDFVMLQGCLWGDLPRPAYSERGEHPVRALWQVSKEPSFVRLSDTVQELENYLWTIWSRTLLSLQKCCQCWLSSPLCSSCLYQTGGILSSIPMMCYTIFVVRLNCLKWMIVHCDKSVLSKEGSRRVNQLFRSQSRQFQYLGNCRCTKLGQK